MLYEVYEGNMPRLTQRLTTLKNKCEKYGCDFHFEILGEIYKKVKDEHTGYVSTLKFIQVFCEGKAIINGWEFIAEVEHTSKGNLFRGISDVQIPHQYRTTGAICEHCHTAHTRRYTYLVRNVETGEFRQVGKSCLKDYTNGLTAEIAAYYTNVPDMMEESKLPYGGLTWHNYISTKDYLAYVAEAVRIFGYIKKDIDEPGTALKSYGYYCIAEGIHDLSSVEYTTYKREMEVYNFTANRKENLDLVENALNWAKQQIESDNDYLYKIAVVSQMEYVDKKNLGLLASLIAAYKKEVSRKEKEEKEKVKYAKSSYVGAIKEKVVVPVSTFQCLTSWYTQFGTTFMYQFIDQCGNVFVWKTSKAIDPDTEIKKLLGTVKAHTEYKGIKQTELTRCKIA